MKTGWTGGQYSLYRVIFGTYLFIHFAELVPWGPELFSSQGVLSLGSESPLIRLFPNIFMFWDGPLFVQVVLALAAGLSLLFAVGWFDRIAAVGLGYIWACLHG